jgi:hypothetical protein
MTWTRGGSPTRLGGLAAGLALGVLAVALLAAGCKGGGSDGGDKSTEDLLRRMALQPGDLPAGLQKADENVTTNEQLIASSFDQAAAREDVERWGRLLSLAVTYLPSPEAPDDQSVQAVSSSSSLYKTAEGGALSFAEGLQDIEQTEWPATHPELKEFQEQRIELEEGLTDELIWLRLTGLSESPKGMVVEDLMIFRIGPQRGFLRVLSASTAEDRDLMREEIEVWLRAQIKHAREALTAEGLI